MKIHFVFHNVHLRLLVGLVFLVGLFALISLASLAEAAGNTPAIEPATARTPPLTEALRQEASGKMLLLDFYSPYCGACRLMESSLSSLKSKTADKITFKRIDVSNTENNGYINQYGIQGTPTYVLYGADGKAVYRMANLIAPSIFEKQVLRLSGLLKKTDFPADVILPEPLKTRQSEMSNMILLSLESKDCQACKTMSPYLTGFELSGEQDGLHVIHVDTETSTGRKMMETLAVKKLPAYILFDNSSPAAGERGELHRIEGEVKPKALWDLITYFGKPGV